jgi:two-component system nitrogen regulation response regulator GlnG
MNASIDIWLVDDDASLRFVMARALERAGLRVRAFASAEECRAALRRERPAVLITDVRMQGEDGMALTRHVRALDDAPPVIVMTAHTDFDSAVTAYEAGAFEYLPKPFDIDELVELTRRAAQPVATAAKPAPREAVPALLGEAPAMQEVFRAIGRLARSSVTVLVTGESGTGKELVARALHRHSPRAAKPFVALNTAAVPTELLESELFGHERGAFTGATAQRRGRFEQADGGTLFLDEIGDMPMALQTRLLRVLAEGEFYRVGGVDAVRVDVRIVAATHQDLERRVRAGTFREDLYHRLNVVRIRVPALRERKRDVPVLLAHFLAETAIELGTDAKRLAPEALDALAGYDWPGNVRELRNLCRRLTALAPSAEVRRNDLPAELFGGEPADADWSTKLAAWARGELEAGRSAVGTRAQEVLERTLIDVALEKSAGKRIEAAQLLGWGRNTLTRKLKR